MADQTCMSDNDGTDLALFPGEGWGFSQSWAILGRWLANISNKWNLPCKDLTPHHDDWLATLSSLINTRLEDITWNMCNADNQNFLFANLHCILCLLHVATSKDNIASSSHHGHSCCKPNASIASCDHAWLHVQLPWRCVKADLRFRKQAALEIALSTWELFHQATHSKRGTDSAR